MSRVHLKWVFAMMRGGRGDDEEIKRIRRKRMSCEERMREREKSGGENRKEMYGAQQFLEGGCLQCKRLAEFLGESLTLATKTWPSSQGFESFRGWELTRLA